MSTRPATAVVIVVACLATGACAVVRGVAVAEGTPSRQNLTEGNTCGEEETESQRSHALHLIVINEAAEIVQGDTVEENPIRASVALDNDVALSANLSAESDILASADLTVPDQHHILDVDIRSGNQLERLRRSVSLCYEEMWVTWPTTIHHVLTFRFLARNQGCQANYLSPHAQYNDGKPRYRAKHDRTRNRAHINGLNWIAPRAVGAPMLNALVMRIVPMLGIVVLVSAGGDVAVRTAPDDATLTAAATTEQTIEYGLGGLETFGFAPELLPDLVGLVGIGTVKQEFERGDGPDENVGPGEPYDSLRDATLELDTVVAGNDELGETVVLADLYGWQYTASGERLEIVEGGVRLRPGDRVLVVLVPEPPNAGPGSAPESAGARYRLLTQYAYVFLEDGRTVDTNRDENEYLRQLESMTEDQLVAELRDACSTGCDRQTYPVLDELSEAPTTDPDTTAGP